jgi:hypothetical protein
MENDVYGLYDDEFGYRQAAPAPNHQGYSITHPQFKVPARESAQARRDRYREAAGARRGQNDIYDINDDDYNDYNGFRHRYSEREPEFDSFGKWCKLQIGSIAKISQMKRYFNSRFRTVSDRLSVGKLGFLSHLKQISTPALVHPHSPVSRPRRMRLIPLLVSSQRR